MTGDGRGRRSIPSLCPGYTLTGALLLTLLACAPFDEKPEFAEPWQSVDLIYERPGLLDLTTDSPEGGVAAETGFAYLGRLPQSRQGRLMPPASLIEALVQKPGTVLVKSIRLGNDSTFQFRPMGGPQGPCHCLYRVWATAATPHAKPADVPDDTSSLDTSPLIRELPSHFGDYPAPRLVLEVSPFRESDAAPEFATADLSAFDGQAVLLLLEVPSTGSGRWRKHPTALWGSPSVRFRAPTGPPSATPSQPGPPSIVMIGADTLRARALGAWGHEPSVTPALDRLARDSEVWLEAYTTFNSTNPSFTSIHTGLYGKNHGVYDHGTFIPEERPTLARQLSAAGYDTFAVFAARHLASAGLADDFDTFFKPDSTAAGELVVDIALHEIDTLRQSERPFFAFLHLFDPHVPHTPPAPFALGSLPARSFGNEPVTEWTTWRKPGPVEFESEWFGGSAKALYYAEVAYMDRQIGRLLGQLETWGLLDSTIVVFLADHGENLDEHSLQFRHVGLWQTTTHVPLMARWPDAWRDKDGWRTKFGARHAYLVQSIDLFPTLLQVAGAEVPSRIDGRSLLSSEGREYVFFEHANHHGQGIRSQHHLLIESLDQSDIENGTLLYELAADPDEVDNVLLEQPDVARALSERLHDWLAKKSDVEAERRPMSDEERRQLEALGYLDG